MRSSNDSVIEYKDKTIAVISGGISTERDVSLRSGKNVYLSLKNMGFTVIELDPSQPSFFDASFDIAFNCLHGKWGEDGGIQGYCELRQIPYTGPGIKATTVGLNKPLFKMVLRQLGIPVPKDISDPNEFPFIAKPVSEGSSIGIEIIKNKAALDDAIKNNPAMGSRTYFFEEYILGKEVTSGVLDINGEVTVFPILEINTSNEFYDYDGKYTPGKTSFILPANITHEMKAEIHKISKQIYDHFECKGCIRIDIMIDESGPKVIEMNTNPGLTDLSDIPAQAKAMGMSFEELMIHYLNSAK